MHQSRLPLHDLAQHSRMHDSRQEIMNDGPLIMVAYLAYGGLPEWFSIDTAVVFQSRCHMVMEINKAQVELRNEQVFVIAWVADQGQSGRAIQRRGARQIALAILGAYAGS